MSPVTGTPVSGGSSAVSIGAAGYAANTYCTLDEVKALLGITGSDQDDLILMLMHDVSRYIEAQCLRHFFVEDGVRYLDATGRGVLMLPDCLSLGALATDSEGDGTYDGESWTEDTDYWLSPHNGWPKLMAEPTGFGNYSMPGRKIRRYWKATGTWGYGDGLSASPWRAIDATVTLADDSTTSAALNATGDGIEAGHTLMVESEQIFVSAVDGTTLTVRRGMNGTTAAAHSAAAGSVARYPDGIVRAARWMSKEAYDEAGREGGLSYEMAGQYQMRVLSEPAADRRLMRMLGPFVRRAV